MVFLPVGVGGDSLPNSQTYAYYLPPENILHLPKVPSSPTKWQFSQKLYKKTPKKLHFLAVVIVPIQFFFLLTSYFLYTQ